MVTTRRPLQPLVDAEGRPYRFLLVDDCHEILTLLEATVMARGGQPVATASDGIRAIELFRRHQPDVVICDIILPGLSGIQVLKALRTIDAEARVILCSADGHPDMLKVAVDAGVSYFLVKPFLSGDLVRAIHFVMQQGIAVPPAQ